MLEFKCGRENCDVIIELTNEELKQMYVLGGGDFTLVELAASINGLKRKTCVGNKFHSFDLTNSSRDKIKDIVNEYKTVGNKFSLEIEPGIAKEGKIIADLEKQLEQARNRKVELETQKVESATKINELEVKFEEIVATNNVILWV